MNFKDEQIANLILSLKKLKGVGSKTIQKFLQDNYREIKQTETYNEQWLEKAGNNLILKALTGNSMSWTNIQKQSSEILEKAYNKNIHVVHPFMDNYPKRMLAKTNYPTILFCIGNIELLNSEKVVAIIGTRNPTNMGIKIGTRLSEKLAQNDYTIVSGLAIGSDTVGHVGALNVKGHTIAVLPTPIDAPIYPKENQELAEKIVKNKGLLVSEYAPGSKLKGRELVSNLIARDEWQPALSDGLIAIETGIKGGSNHAIRHAINTKTPLGIFDYSNNLRNQFYDDERFSGNVKYLTNNQAVSIFTEESIILFQEEMKAYNEKLKNNYNSLYYRENINNNEYDFKQTNLF